MLRNYFIVAFRNLKRNKLFSLINVGGLAVGLAACWLISLYVANELSYDTWHANAGRIYRVAQHATWPGGHFNLAVTPPPMAKALINEYPEIEQVVRLDAEGGGIMEYGTQKIKADDVLFADSSFFKVFSYSFLYGDANTALYRPQSLVLTASLAKKIFGDPAEALNKVISFGTNNTATVTGVIEDVPTNAHFAFSALRSMPHDLSSNWENSYLYTYILMKDKTDMGKLSAKLPAFFNKYLKTSVGDADYHLEMQPLTSIHLHSNLDYELGTNGNFSYIAIFSLVALLILIIASINYMNLSTARSSLRVKEIGVRKVNGSGRGQLVVMFLSESVLITFIAALLALAILNLVLPWFQQFVGKQLAVWHFGLWRTLAFLFSFSLVAGCISGIYPALFLSGFRLIPALKGQTGTHKGNMVFRQSLVVFQFVVTIAMIAGSFVIWLQLQYVSTKDMGFNKDQVITFHLSKSARKQIPAIRQQLLQSPLIESVGTAGNPIGNNNIGSTDYTVTDGGPSVTRSNKAHYLQVDEDFIPVMQIHMLAGRNFSVNMLTDKDNAVVVNETLAKDAGWKNPIGKKIQFGKDSLGKPALFEVVGVTRDFNIYSLQHKVEPLILQIPQQVNDKDNMYVRISRSKMKDGLAFVGSVYTSFDSSGPFEFSFLDQNFAKQYAAEKMQGNLLLILTALAISIACLGLLGLVTFTAEQRRKEIGIRKVLGGSVTSIVGLLAKDLLKLVAIAVLIATPVAWLACNRWLQDFAYRVAVSWWIFIAAGSIALLIAFITISFKAVRAGLANPVKSLRTE